MRTPRCDRTPTWVQACSRCEDPRLSQLAIGNIRFTQAYCEEIRRIVGLYTVLAVLIQGMIVIDTKACSQTTPSCRTSRRIDLWSRPYERAGDENREFGLLAWGERARVTIPSCAGKAWCVDAPEAGKLQKCPWDEFKAMMIGTEACSCRSSLITSFVTPAKLLARMVRGIRSPLGPDGLCHLCS
ncbi:hypothetical protein K491DRAFT_276925 [Lophiostoma macrostomum CBS 122681]|uniref:Uncharacterized protein n=1 Tax=Lophiostoma macrostomum CBS 122681 TaxID=1314788 RepID=A0A6A6SML8_9PLEO|nr:hypothetical protein K491DRAFT_276925 [Lophiostoma macrostomum CBS 122681]